MVAKRLMGLEDRGYYELDGPFGRKTRDYLVRHSWNREGYPISNGVTTLSCLHIGVSKQKQSPDDFTTGSRSMRSHWWTCTASLELHGCTAHGTHSASSLKLLRRNLVWWAEYSLLSPFVLVQVLFTGSQMVLTSPEDVTLGSIDDLHAFMQMVRAGFESEFYLLKRAEG